jgi:hypothetical protein
MSVPFQLGKNVVTRIVSWRAMVLESWGEEWAQRSVSYRFSDGTEKQSTDSTNKGIYSGQGGGGGGG